MSLSIKSIVGSVLLALGTSAAMAAVPTVPSQPVAGPTPSPDAPATVGGTDGNSGLIVSVYDTVRGVSLTTYLGLNFKDFQPGDGNATPSSGLALDFGTLTNYSSVFGASDAANIKYTIAAGDYLPNSVNDAILGKALLTTIAPGANTVVRNGALSDSVTALRSFVSGALNGASGCAGVNPCVASTSADGGYAGGANWGDKYANKFPVSAASTVGTAMGFYLVSAAANTTFSNATVTQFANASGVATWLLDAAGHLTYNVPSAVPLPAGVWLLLSGLTGLGVIGRRRKAGEVAAA